MLLTAAQLHEQNCKASAGDKSTPACCHSGPAGGEKVQPDQCPRRTTQWRAETEPAAHWNKKASAARSAAVLEGCFHIRPPPTTTTTTTTTFFSSRRRLLLLLACLLACLDTRSGIWVERPLVHCDDGRRTTQCRSLCSLQYYPLLRCLRVYWRCQMPIRS
jgi:hypothetical protein